MQVLCPLLTPACFSSLLRLRPPACVAIAHTARLNESIRNNNILFSPRRSIDLLIYFFNSILVLPIFCCLATTLGLLCLFSACIKRVPFATFFAELQGALSGSRFRILCEEAAAAAAGVGRQHTTWPWFRADGKCPLVWLHYFFDCFGRCETRGRGPEVLQWRVEVFFCKFSLRNGFLAICFWQIL